MNINKLKQTIRHGLIRLSNRWNVLLLTLMTSTPAYAGIDISAITNGLQATLDILSGSAARISGGIGIAYVGYRWMTGHMDLKFALPIAFGIGLILGAPDIVDALWG